MAIHLDAARRNARLTQNEVVQELRKRGFKISKNTLSNYEAYKTKPSIDVAKALADLYGMSVDNIIFYPDDCA